MKHDRFGISQKNLILVDFLTGWEQNFRTANTCEALLWFNNNNMITKHLQRFPICDPGLAEKVSADPVIWPFYRVHPRDKRC